MQGSGSAPRCQGSPTPEKTRIKVRKADLLSGRYVNVKEGQHLAELASIAEAGRHPAFHQELHYQGNLKQIPDIKLEHRQVGLVVVLQSLRSVEVYSHIYYVNVHRHRPPKLPLKIKARRLATGYLAFWLERLVSSQKDTSSNPLYEPTHWGRVFPQW